MTTFPEQPLYGIAAGWNATESDRIAIQGYTPAVTNAFPFPYLHSYGTYSPGQLIVRGDQSSYFQGFPSLSWSFNALDYVNQRWAMDTFAGGGYSGQVTIWTTNDTPNILQKFNAIVRFPTLPNLPNNIPTFNAIWTFLLQTELAYSEFLLETGDNFLLETGDLFLLEG